MFVQHFLVRKGLIAPRVGAGGSGRIIVQLHVPHQGRLEAKHHRAVIALERFLHFELRLDAYLVNLSEVFSEEVYPGEGIAATFCASEGVNIFVFLLVMVQRITSGEFLQTYWTLVDCGFFRLHLDMLDVNSWTFAHLLSR